MKNIRKLIKLYEQKLNLVSFAISRNTKHKNASFNFYYSYCSFRSLSKMYFLKYITKIFPYPLSESTLNKIMKKNRCSKILFTIRKKTIVIILGLLRKFYFSLHKLYFADGQRKKWKTLEVSITES